MPFLCPICTDVPLWTGISILLLRGGFRGMEKFFWGVRFVVYVIILDQVLAWMGQLLINNVHKVERGMDKLYQEGFWSYIWSNNSYLYVGLMVLTFTILTYAVTYLVKISCFPKTTKIATYIWVALKALFFSGMAFDIIYTEKYSDAVKLMTTVFAFFIMLTLFAPFIFGVLPFGEEEPA